ncbi:MAG: carbon-nitrogen hydrolase family protein [Rubrivivax sp.]|jgi:nitrilase
MRVAALQMVSTPNVHRNLDTAATLLRQASERGAALAVLPEYFCLMGQRDTDKLSIAESPGDGPVQRALAGLARELGLWIVGGTLPLQVAGHPDRVTNSCLTFSPDGQCCARYDKVHLFAFDNGRERYDESRVLRAGQEAVKLSLEAAAERWNLGFSVCYDLRFPELYRRLGQLEGGCDVVCVPSAFTYTTGQAHWELLLRARAIENQCFVIAAAQGGLHENGRTTWGHSMLIDPWGQVLAQCPQGEAVVLADLDHRRLEQVRTQLPALRHRVW